MAPIVLIIAVTAAPDAGALMNEAAAACLQTLPPGATTIIRQTSVLPDDAEIRAQAAAIRATASVVVTWRDAARLLSDVRVLIPSTIKGRGSETFRTIVFSARDLPAERGRALGLVIGSILGEAWGTAVQSRPEVAEPKSRSAAYALSDTEVPAALGPLDGKPLPAPPQWAIEASVITGVDRQEAFDDTIGGMIALRRTLRPHWAARAGLGLRAVDLDKADASARTTLAELGLVWSIEGIGPSRAFGVGARIDVLGAHEALSHSDGDDSQFAELWTLGADVLGQVGLGLSAGTTLLLSLGAEGVLSSAQLAVSGEPTAQIPDDRVILELGVLSRF